MNQATDSSGNDLSLDDILDSSIDDLADLPEFGVYPAGTHRVLATLESKKVNDHPCVELKMKAIETLELASASDDVLAQGAESSVLFMMDNEFGQGKAKTVIKAFSIIMGTNTIRETVEATKDVEVTVVTKVRWNKDKTTSYTDVSKILT